MSDSTKQSLENLLQARVFLLDAESDRRLRDAVENTPAQTGETYSWRDYLRRLTDIFRVEEEQRVSEIQSTLLNAISSHIDQSDEDVVDTAVAVLNREATRIRDRFAVHWREIVPPRISPPSPQDDSLQRAQQGLAIHAEASRSWRRLEVADKIRSLKSASNLYKANMRAAEANEAAARASEESARAAEKMVTWTRWAALFTALAAIATAVGVWSAFRH